MESHPDAARGPSEPAPFGGPHFARLALLLGAAGFAIPGLGFLLAPATFAELVDVGFLGPTAWSDVRALFGGLELGLATCLILCALRPSLHGTGLVLLLACVAGLLLGRLVSLSADGAPGPFGWILLGLELALLALAGAALVGLQMGGGRSERDAEGGS